MFAYFIKYDEKTYNGDFFLCKPVFSGSGAANCYMVTFAKNEAKATPLRESLGWNQAEMTAANALASEPFDLPIH